MKGYCIRNVWFGILSLCFLFCWMGCEVKSADLFEFDENGNRINNSKINIGASLLRVGMNAYANDSLYTALILEKQRSGGVKILGFRKGVVSYRRNGTIESLSWDKKNPRVQYGYDYTYSYNGYDYKILALEDHGFVEDMEIWKDGNLSLQLKYYYDIAGYLVKVELLNKRSTIYFYYDYRKKEKHSNSITIIEKPASRRYTIRLAPDKLENKGYICNVLRYSQSSLINEYIINPDLYYLGIYGTPVKYLPDEAIERGSYRDKDGVLESVYSRVGYYKYFYEGK